MRHTPIPILFFATILTGTLRGEEPREPGAPAKSAAVEATQDAPFDNFFFAAFIPEMLAAEPGREKELEFAMACRPNLMSEFHRGKSNRDLIDEFRRDFDRSKVSDATRLIVINLVERQAGAAREEDLKLANLLYSQLKPTSPEEQAYALSLRTEIARRWCYDYGFESELKKLFDLLTKDPQAPWLMRRPMLAITLFSRFEHEGLISYIPNATQANLSRAFFERLEQIPPEKRGSAVSSYLGNRHVSLAWKSRGGKWASLTSEKQFDGFNKHLVIAARELRRAHELDPKRIGPLMRLMTVAMADSQTAGGDVAHWLEKARKCPGFGADVLNEAAFCSAARWCGDTDLILRACDELIAYGYDTDGPLLAHSAFLQFLKDVPEDKQDPYKDLVAKRLVEIGNGYLRRELETKLPALWHDGLPLDFRTLVTTKLFDLDRIGYASGLISDSALTKNEESNEYPVAPLFNHQYLRKLVAFESGDTGAIEELFPLFDSGMYTPIDAAETDRRTTLSMARHTDAAALEKADKRLAEIEKRLTSDTTRTYVKDLRELLAMEKSVMSGGSVTLPFKATLWNKSFGHWTLSDTTAKAWEYRMDPYLHLATTFAQFRPPYEVKLKVKSEFSAGGAKVGITVNRFTGWSPTKTPSPGRSFVLQSGNGLLTAYRPHPDYAKPLVQTKTSPKPTEFTITLRVMEHGYSLGLNNEKPKGARDDKFVPAFFSVGNLPLNTGWGAFEYQAPVIRGLRDEELSAEEKSWMQDNAAGAAQEKAPDPRANES